MFPVIGIEVNIKFFDIYTVPGCSCEMLVTLAFGKHFLTAEDNSFKELMMYTAGALKLPAILVHNIFLTG